MLNYSEIANQSDCLKHEYILTSIIHKALARNMQITETSPRPTITKEKLSFLGISLPGVA